MSFRDDFAWGAAAASYQVEGAADADGKGPSVWDMMCRVPGRIWEGHTGDVACDHYHRYRDDVAVMKSIGLRAYRLSVSWPRVMPDGTGAVNDAGLAFYDRLVDELLAAGVAPWVTLFHWDYPLALYHRGGWLNRQSVEWFADYARVIVDRLGDRVRHWMTLNEPQCFIGLGHQTGMHAPGLKLGMADVLLAGHHALMAHGRAVSVIRARAKVPPTVGWAPVGVVQYPVDEHDPACVEASRAAMFTANMPRPQEAGGLWNNTWFSDPVILGHYPEESLRAFGRDAPKVRPGDYDVMKQPLDFYGMNIYNGFPFKPDPADPTKNVITKRPEGFPITKFDWPVEPKSLYWGPKFTWERYGLPIVVTENGMSGHDWVSLDGACHDPQRIDFLARYLSELKRAAADGVDVRGYFLWSIMDNFEWAEGYKQRFGIVHVDYATQVRTLKDSAGWYGAVIRTNGANLP